MISVQNLIVFEGQKSTPEERGMLRECGFVHVTGLRTICRRGLPSYVIGEKLRKEDFGRLGIHNQYISIVTMGGEVWLRAEMKEVEPEIGEIWKKLCPNGSGAFVPLSNGESTDIHELLARIVDPDFEIVYKS
jgi:hypothetical protein